jgi:hypothetical protein
MTRPAGPPDDFDPTRALDGWRPAVPPTASDADATGALDGWQLDGTRRTPRADLDDVEDVKARMVVDLPARDRPPSPSAADFADVGRSASRLAASLGEVVDVEPAWQPAVQTWTPQKARDPRLLHSWRPGAWLGAVVRVMGPSAEIVESPQGPVVESFPPHLLLALWPPQSLQNPFIGCWPDQVLFAAVEPDEVGSVLLPHIPEEAPLWLGEPEIDWAALAELAMLHQPELRPFQLKGLRAFVEAVSEAAFKRQNDQYHQPAPGLPVRRKPVA